MLTFMLSTRALLQNFMNAFRKLLVRSSFHFSLIYINGFMHQSIDARCFSFNGFSRVSPINLGIGFV